jgi:hypothetical protein
MPGPAGLDAVPGDDLVDLGAAAAAGAGPPTLAEVAGVPYVAAAGGIARADLAAGTGWVAATPAAWASRASAPGSGDLAWPGRRAVPALAAFGDCAGGPCLVAARSVAGTAGQPALVPQLWTCAPAAAPAACDPGDWTLAAPDPDDPQVTRLGAPGHGPASLLAATDRWLYVGLDDDARGARLYRTARAPRAASDLVGRAGCSAAASTCEGLGGNGLGAGATRFAGAVRADVGGVPTLWILAGDGSGPLVLLRIAD